MLVVVAWFSHSVYVSVKPVYYSQAVIGVAPPSEKVYNSAPGVPLPRNGLIDIGGAQLVANLAAIGLRQPAVVDRVVAAGGLPYYDSRMFPVAGNVQQMPLIMIDVTDANPALATKTLEVVISQAEVTLRSLQQQARVPDDQMVIPFAVTPPTPPAAAMPSRTRSTIATFAAGAGLSILLTVLFDTAMIRRKSRSRQRPPATIETGAGLDSVEVDAKPDSVDPQAGNHRSRETASTARGALDAG
jgi:hypothetical protein